jgi:hypothetical protein
MKVYPLHDTHYTLSGDKIHVSLMLTEEGNLGIEIFSLVDSRIPVEADNQRLFLRELKLAFIGQDSQDFLAALKALLKLVDYD